MRGSQRHRNSAGHVSYVVRGDGVCRIPTLGYKPDENQDLVYFDNWGPVLFNPPQVYVSNDFGLGDAISDHSMGSYKEMVNDMHLSIAELRHHRQPLRRV